MNDELARQVRGDFPILATTMAGHPLVYLDNAATTQKPQAVIDALVHFYTHDNANIHRGVYELSQRATDGYEAARASVAHLLGGVEAAECIFVRGTTEAINIVASCWGKTNLSTGDEVLLTGLEHHSNIVPWQMACDQTGATLRAWQPNDEGELPMEELDQVIHAGTKFVSIQHVSNALGTIHDIDAIIRRAKAVGARVLIDGAQWIGHYPTNVAQLDCDFYVFSAHKLYAPTGLGVLWGRRELLEAMPPFQGGGDMIETVSFEKSTYAPLPNRFEAGTPHIAGAIGLGAAIDYVQHIGFDRIAAYEDELLAYATQRMSSVPGLRIIGTAKRKAAINSFVMESPSIAPLDIATHLSSDGIAIRTGHHCCMPLMGHMQVSGTSRVSMAYYNTLDDIDRLTESLSRLSEARQAKRQAAKAAAGTNEPAKAAVAGAALDGTAVDGTAQTTTPAAADSNHEVAGITFAAAVQPTIAESADVLAEEFLLFDDRESKTEMLMELGQALPDSFESLKLISTAVPGCMSEVYLVGRPMPAQPSRFEFAADSNAEVVRGLIAILQHLFSGHSAEEVLQFDVEAFFRRIGLDQFVSTQRRSGLNGMIQRIKTLATSITDRDAAE